MVNIWTDEIGISVEHLVAAVAYFLVMSFSFFIFLVLQTKQSISLQRNMYLLVTFETLFRCVQSIITAVEDLLYVEVPSLTNNSFLRYTQEAFDMLSFIFGFAIYLCLVAFWAENFVLFLKHSPDKESFELRGKVRTGVLTTFWVIITVVFIIGESLASFDLTIAAGVTVLFGCIVFKVDTRTFTYELARGLYRIILNVISMVLMLGFCIALCCIYRVRFRSIPGSKLPRMITFTVLITLVLLLFVLFNIVRIALWKQYRDFDYKWIVFLIMSGFDILISILVLIMLKPKNMCTCNFRAIEEIDLGLAENLDPEEGVDEELIFDAAEDDTDPFL